MSGADDLLAALLVETGELLHPLGDASASPEALAAFLSQLGWVLDAQTTGQIEAMTTVGARLGELLALVEAVGAARANPAQLAALVPRARAAVEPVVTAVRAIAAQPPGTRPPLNDPQFWQSVPPDVLELLLARHLARRRPRIDGPLRALGVAREERRPAIEGGRAAYTRRWVDLDRLADAVTDPASIPSGVYGWGGELDTDALFDAIGGLAHGFGVASQPAELPARTWDPGAEAGSALTLILWSDVLVAGGEIVVRELDVVLSPLPADGQRGGRPVGIELVPRLTGRLNGSTALAPGVTLTLTGELGSDDALRVELRPGNARVVTGTGASSLKLRVAAEPAEPYLVLGTRGGSRLEIARAHAELSIAADASGGELSLAIAIERAIATIDLADADGFLTTLIGSRPRSLEFAVGLVWSSRTGLRFQAGPAGDATGAAGAGAPRLELDVPIDVELGPLSVDEGHLALTAADGGAGLEVALSGALALGPVTVTVTRLGIRAVFARAPAGDGALGDHDLRVGLRPPTGVALSVDAGPVTGAGFLSYDPDAHKYAGGVDLEFAGLRLSAIGLLATRMPDGRPGFSLLVIIQARFPKPIPLGFGFGLAAVGGLVGINRAVDVERMRSGLRDGSLSSILAPGDVVGNDRRLLDDLDELFPVTPGRHLFGPTARLTWGVPTVVEIDLALALELPKPLRFIAAGRVRMALPDARKPIAVINLDALGVLDTGEGTLSLDAVLHDSQIAGWQLSGEMALRARWTAPSLFVMSAGGFHPRFKAPPNFPALRRMALSIGDGDVRIRLEAYLALTSNTLQLGSRVELYAKAGDFTAEGTFTFDAIVRFSPFGFELDVSLAVSIRWKGRLLLGITADVHLSGPGRWQVRGQATIHLLFLKTTVRFQASFGSAAALAPAPPQDVLALVRAALAEPGAWRVQERAPLAALTMRPGIELADMLVSPSAQVSVRQRIAPLGATLDRFGAVGVDGARQLRVAEARLGAMKATTDDVKDEFAPAQFFDMSDEEKLSSPSFDLMSSGVSFRATEALSFDTQGPEAIVIAYRTFVVDAPDQPARAVAATKPADGAGTAGKPKPGAAGGSVPSAGAGGADAVLGGVELDRLAHVGAAGRAETRASGLARFDAPGLDVRVEPDAYLVVSAATLAPAGPQPAAGERWSRSEALQRRRRWLAQHPGDELTVVAAHEAAQPVAA